MIHPNQIRAVQEEFSPSAERISWATELIAAFEEHQKLGKVPPHISIVSHVPHITLIVIVIVATLVHSRTTTTKKAASHKTPSRREQASPCVLCTVSAVIVSLDVSRAHYCFA